VGVGADVYIDVGADLDYAAGAEAVADVGAGVDTAVGADVGVVVVGGTYFLCKERTLDQYNNGHVCCVVEVALNLGD